MQAAGLPSMTAISPNYKDACTSPSSADGFNLQVEEDYRDSSISIDQNWTQSHSAHKPETFSQSCRDWTKRERHIIKKMLSHRRCVYPLLTLVLLLVMLSAVGASFLTTSMVLSRSRLSRRGDTSGMPHAFISKLL